MKQNNDKSKPGSVAKKLKSLEKQYNKILIKLFEEHTVTCIENALKNTDGSFGENIEAIVQTALDDLKTKVMGELGIGCGCSCDPDGTSIDGIIGAMGIGDFDEVEIIGDAEDEDDDAEESEDQEDDEGDEDDGEDGGDEDEKEEETVEESVKPKGTEVYLE